MGKITTREEISLKYLESPEKLEKLLIYEQVEDNPETKAAVLEIGAPELLYSYGVFILKRDDPEIRAALEEINDKRRVMKKTSYPPDAYHHVDSMYDNWVWWYNEIFNVLSVNGNKLTPGIMLTDSDYWAWRRGLFDRTYS